VQDIALDMYTGDHNRAPTPLLTKN